jgi:hypothetical protein
MADDRKRLSLNDALVALAAGAASALLFLLSSRGTYGAMALSYFAPLPLMIATLSFGLGAGGIAALVAGAVLAILGSPVLALVVCGVLLLPSWLICIVATRVDETGDEDRRTSRVLVACVVFAALIALAAVAAMIMTHGGFAKARAAVIAGTVPLLKTVVAGERLPDGLSVDELAHVVVGIMPAIVAASALVMLLLNVYIAGRVALISDRLPKGWPPIADTIGLPPVFAVLFAAACGLVFLSNLPGMVASIAASALGMGFAMQGLAVLHVLSRGSGMRGGILFALYALIVFVPAWPFVLLALVGLADTAFHLRRKRIAASTRNP